MKPITYRVLLAGWIVFQFVSIFVLWSHTSDSGEVLGRFSLRYAAVLVVNLALMVALPLLFAQSARLETWLNRLSRPVRYDALALLVLAMLALGFLPLESVILEYAAVNLVAAALILGWNDPPRLPTWLLPAAALLALPLMLATVLISFPFSPDEAHWADYASTAILDGGVYARTWLQTPYTVYPGIGWSVAGYGWSLEHVGFDIRTGRLWNFAAYLLAFAGIAALTGRLYGRRAALFSTAFAALSFLFIPVFDYRPDHQIPLATVWVVLAVAQARFSRRRYLWDILAGLLAALALELHAIAIALVFGVGLYYAAVFAYRLLVEHRRELAPLLAYALGALIGGGIYYALNVAPVGGLTPFLQSLVSERFQSQRGLYFLMLPSLFDAAVILAAFAFIVWRRQAADRFLIGIILCLWVALFVFDTQGYHSPMISLYSIPVGALIAAGVGQQRSLAAACLAAAMVGQISGFIAWDGLTSPPNYAYAEVRSQILPYLRPDDTILTTHLMIWSLYDAPRLYSTAGELTAMKRWNLTDPVQVWDRVQPSVVIYIPDQMELNPGVVAYMNAHDFKLCQQLQVQMLSIEIERPVC